MHIASVAIGQSDHVASTKAGAHRLAERTQNMCERIDTRHNVDRIHNASGGGVANRLEHSQLTRIERDAAAFGTYVNYYTSRFDEAEGPSAARGALKRAYRGFTRIGCHAELFESLHCGQKSSQRLAGHPVKATSDTVPVL